MKHKYNLIIICAIIFSLYNCRDEENLVEEIKTANISEIEDTSALGGGSVTVNEEVLEMGVFVSSENTTDPTIENDTVRARNTKKGAFACYINGLLPDTEYNVRAFIKTISGFKYGNTVVFRTAREPGKPEMGEVTVDTVGESNVVLSSHIIFNGGLKGDTIMKGFFYSKDRTLLPDSTNNVSEPGASRVDTAYVIEKMNPIDSVFTLTMQFLLPNTTYYCKSFMKNKFGVGYGNEFSFNTLEKQTPIVSIGKLEEEMVSYTSVKCSGNMSYGGSSPVIEKGFCAGTSNKPSDAKYRVVADNTDVGDYELQLQELLPNTIYYLWCYAKNNNGIAYSEPLSFKTLPISTPVIESSAYITNMTLLQGATNTVNVSANMTRTGGSNILVRGFCFADSPDPTTYSDKIIISGTDLGVFSTTIRGLSPGKVYYVRPYASNIFSGVGYGKSITFKIPDLSELVLIKGAVYSPKCLSTPNSNLSDFYVSKLEVVTDDFAEFLTAYGATDENFNTNQNSDFPYMPLIVKNPESQSSAASFKYNVDSHNWTAAEGRSGKAAGYITWFGAYEFAKWKGGFMPSAAYWEYAAIGADLSLGYKFSGSNVVGDVAWTNGVTLEAPGQKNANELGIFDMTGNAWEWISNVRDDITGYRKGGSINEVASSLHQLVTNVVSTTNRVKPNWNMGFRYFRIKD